MMADSIRFGKVSNINYKTGCMEVTYEDREDSVTDMIPMLANAGFKMPATRSRKPRRTKRKPLTEMLNWK